MKNVTALVVGLDEEILLKKSLPRLSSFDELIYVDLKSKDNSVQIASSLGAKVVEHERVSVVEIIHAELISQSKYDWVLITDPDEIVDNLLLDELEVFVNSDKNDNIGMVAVPIQFYFKNYCLKGTIWGGSNSRITLVNKNRVKFTPSVHRGRQLVEGFSLFTIIRNGDNVIRHYWMSSYKQLFEKHRRYILKEGESMYNNGQRANFLDLIRTPFRAFKECYYTKQGFKDGLIGFNLSLFWIWYKTNAYISLINYQNKIDSNKKVM